MKATIAKFNYSQKARKVLVLSKPSDTYFGVEFKDESELANFVDYLVEKEQMEAYLKAKYALVDVNYKRFKEDSMSRLTEQTVADLEAFVS